MRRLEPAARVVTLACALTLFIFFEQVDSPASVALVVAIFGGFFLQLLLALHARAFDRAATLATSFGPFGYFAPWVFFYGDDSHRMPTWLASGSLALAFTGLLSSIALAVARRRTTERRRMTAWNRR